MMPVREGATRRARGEIGTQPLLLDRADAHVDGAVQHDDVPVAEVVAVEPLRRGARRRPEVAVVARGAAGLVIQITRRRPRPGAVPPPRWTVAVAEVGA